MVSGPIIVSPAVVSTPIAPFAPLGRPSGGSGPSVTAEDSAHTAFSPIEEAEEGQRSGELATRDRDAKRGERGGSSSETARKRAEERQEQEEIRKLAARDREVRAHEQAHASVGGQYAGAPSFSYTRGPDGVLYAVGGEVPIDVSKVPGDPVATLRKLQIVQRAALAPRDPSPADRSIAGQAARGQVEARAELAAQRADEAAARRAELAGDDEADRNQPRVGGRSLAERVAGTGALDNDQSPRFGSIINTAA